MVAVNVERGPVQVREHRRHQPGDRMVVEIRRDVPHPQPPAQITLVRTPTPHPPLPTPYSPSHPLPPTPHPPRLLPAPILPPNRSAHRFASPSSRSRLISGS